MKKVIISGASGYMGKRFLSKYGQDLEIIALCRNVENITEKEILNNVRVIDNKSFLEKFKENLDDFVLLNLAFPRTSEIDLILNSFDFTIDLYKKVTELGCKKIINISSQSVYDKNRKKPANEKDLTRPFDLYGIAKMYMENQTKNFSTLNSLDYINIRLASIIGPKFNQRFINKLIDSYLNDRNISIKENGYIYSFLNVDDAIDGLYKIIVSKNLLWNQIYNLGSHFSYTISDVMKGIETISKHKYKGNINFEKVEDRLETNQVDISLLLSQILWTPKFNLNESIKQILKEQFKENI